MKIKIDDSNQLLKIACEDLQALQAVILAAEDHPEYVNEHEMLIVVRRALAPIITDIQDAINAIDEELKCVQQV